MGVVAVWGGGWCGLAVGGGGFGGGGGLVCGWWVVGVVIIGDSERYLELVFCFRNLFFVVFPDTAKGTVAE